MTTTAQPATAPAQLAPYIFFYGRCEEALAFYAGVLGGTYEVRRNADIPQMREYVSADFQQKVMHASFTAPGVVFMASDGREAKTVNPDEGNVSLSLSATTRAEGERLFNALADGGKIEHPFSDAFWGGMFGMLNDRFGTQWMIVSP